MPPRHKPQQDEGDRLLDIERCNHLESKVRNREGRIRTDQDPPDRRRSTGGHNDGKKLAIRHFRQENFESKQHAAERRIERGGNTGAGGQQSDLLPRRNSEQLRKGGAERRAHLNDHQKANPPLFSDGLTHAVDHRLAASESRGIRHEGMNEALDIMI